MAATASPVLGPWQAWDCALDSHRELLQVRGPWCETFNSNSSSEGMPGCEGAEHPCRHPRATHSGGAGCMPA